jgi:hypothetical protein
VARNAGKRIQSVATCVCLVIYFSAKCQNIKFTPECQITKHPASAVKCKGYYLYCKVLYLLQSTPNIITHKSG